MKRAKVRKPRPMKLGGEIILEFATSAFGEGQEHVSLFSNLLPNRDIKKIATHMLDMIAYLESKKGKK